MTPTPAVLSGDVLRTMAHDLRQPLSTIESIAYYLTLVLPKEDEKIQEQLNRIQQLVEQSSWIVTSAQQLSEPLRVTRQPFSIEDLIEQIIVDQSATGAGPDLTVDGELPLVNADAGLTRALIENLLTLLRGVSTPAFPVTVRLRREGGGVAIELETGAPGYKSEVSLGPGATLGIESARRIAAAQGGSFDSAMDPADGVRLRVMLP